MNEASRSIPKHCQGTRKDGRPCTALVMGAGVYCFAHDPRRAEERQEARARGGQGKATARRLDKLLPATLRPVIGALLDALEEVHAGTLDPRAAGAMASLAGAVGRLYSVGVLEDRIAALEAAPPSTGEAPPP